MKIVIAEDHAMFREVLRKVCVEECHDPAVGEAGGAAMAITLVQKHRPDALLLDIGLPDKDGFAVAEAALQVVPSIRILIVSSHLNEYLVSRCEQLRIHGYVGKTCSVETLREAVRSLAYTKGYVSPEFLAARRAWRADPQCIEKRLSDREQEVFSLTALGLNDEEIGLRLNISKHTAQHHRTNIIQNLGLPGTPKLMALAIKKGWGRLR